MEKILKKIKQNGQSFDRLLKADDPSPFPALTQFSVFGKDYLE